MKWCCFVLLYTGVDKMWKSDINAVNIDILPVVVYAEGNDK